MPQTVLGVSIEVSEEGVKLQPDQVKRAKWVKDIQQNLQIGWISFSCLQHSLRVYSVQQCRQAHGRRSIEVGWQAQLGKPVLLQEARQNDDVPDLSSAKGTVEWNRRGAAVGSVMVAGSLAARPLQIEGLEHRRSEGAQAVPFVLRCTKHSTMRSGSSGQRQVRLLQ